jgi:hypothetical protein
MRFLPELTITCHVCRSAFKVHNRMDTSAGRMRMRQDPKARPSCDAPIAPAGCVDVGIAKGLVLLDVGASAEKREYGTPDAYLKRHCVTVADVDALMKLCAEMDLDAWEAQLHALLPYDRALRGELSRLPRIRRAAESGQMMA